MQSLADFLGVNGPMPGAAPGSAPGCSEPDPLDALTGKEFAQAVLNSPEFRRYIVNGLRLGDLAPGVLCRLMDHGWGKPVEKIEHSGRDGQPIETITEVRRVVVRVGDAVDTDEEDERTVTTH